MSMQLAQLNCYAALCEPGRNTQLHNDEIVTVDEAEGHHHEDTTHSHKHRHSPDEPEHEHSHTHLNTSTADIHLLYSAVQFNINGSLEGTYSFNDQNDLRPYQFIFEIFRPPIS